MNLTAPKIASITLSKNSTEYENAVDAIKAARNGQYPPDWYATFLAGGQLQKIRAGWTDGVPESEPLITFVVRSS